MKAVKEKKSRTFVEEVFNKIPAFTHGNVEKNDKLEAIPKTIATTPRPNKAEVSMRTLSRFQKECA